MEFKRLISHFTYKIEAKPEGGFIARASDPSAPPLEAATREELQQKIQASIASVLAANFPGLKVPLETGGAKFSFHIEHKPEGGFVLQSTDGKELPFTGATHAEIESKFAEKVLGALGSGLIPELTKALAAQAGSGNVKVVVNRKVSFSAGKSGVAASSAGAGQADDAGAAALLNAGNTPITPEASKFWPALLFVLGLIVLIGIFFFRFK